GKVGNDALKTDRQQVASLHPGKTAIPIGQPLRRHGGERRQHRHHQRGSDQGLDQGETRDRGSAAVAAALHSLGLGRNRTVLTCSTDPAGVWTLITTAIGIQGGGRLGSTFTVRNGTTSAPHRWFLPSP